MNNKLNIYEQNNIELKNKIIKYEHDINYLKIKNQELEKNNNDINYKFEAVNIELEKKKDKNSKFEDEIMKIKTEKMVLESDMNDLKEKVNKFRKDKEKYKCNIQLFVDENKEAANCIKKLNLEIKN